MVNSHSNRQVPPWRSADLAPTEGPGQGGAGRLGRPHHPLPAGARPLPDKVLHPVTSNLMSYLIIWLQNIYKKSKHFGKLVDLKLDGVGPVDNRPSNDKLHLFEKFSKIKNFHQLGPTGPSWS